MSKEHLSQFQQVIEQDQMLQDQLSAAPDNASFEQMFVQLGAGKGYSFTREELRAELASQAGNLADGELNDAELEEVAGGLCLVASCNRTIPPRSTYSFNCTDGSGPLCAD